MDEVWLAYLLAGGGGGGGGGTIDLLGRRGEAGFCGGGGGGGTMLGRGPPAVGVRLEEEAPRASGGRGGLAAPAAAGVTGVAVEHETEQIK